MGIMTLERALEMAISQENASQEFYGSLAEKVHDAATRDTLLFLAEEEARHKALLKDYKEGRGGHGGALGGKDPVDARLVETLGTPHWNPQWKAEEAFLWAAEKEKEACEFYENLARLHPEGEVKELLRKLAREELAHKEKMEYLYANTAYPQTDGG